LSTLLVYVDVNNGIDCPEFNLPVDQIRRDPLFLPLFTLMG